MTLKELLQDFGFGWFRGWFAAAALGLGLTTLFAGRFDLLALFYTAEMELTYAEDLSDVDCIRRTFCFVHYRFDIANTGDDPHRLVTVVFHGMPDEAGWGRRVLPLSGDATDTAGADVSFERLDEGPAIIIENFAPGTLVRLEFVDKQMPREVGEGLLDGSAEVRGSGRHVQADPRATAFGRFVSAVF